MSLLLDVARAAAWVLPASRAKNAVLRSLGHDVHPTAVVRSVAVWKVRRVTVAEGAHIARHTFFRHLQGVTLGREAWIGAYNVITAHPAFAPNPGGGTLVLGDHAKITGRHSIDCSAAVTIGAYASIAGRGSTLMTHSVDLAIDAQRARPIIIGERSFVGTRSLVLGGAVLPPRSVLGAGAVLLPGRGADEPGLFGGVPARRIGDVSGAWFDRTGTHTRHVVVPSEDGGEQIVDF